MTADEVVLERGRLEGERSLATNRGDLNAVAAVDVALAALDGLVVSVAQVEVPAEPVVEAAPVPESTPEPAGEAVAAPAAADPAPAAP